MGAREVERPGGHGDSAEEEEPPYPISRVRCRNSVYRVTKKKIRRLAAPGE